MNYETLIDDFDGQIQKLLAENAKCNTKEK